MVSPTPHQNNTRMSRCGSFAWSTVTEKTLRSDSRIALPPRLVGSGSFGISSVRVSRDRRYRHRSTPGAHPRHSPKNPLRLPPPNTSVEFNRINYE